MINFHCLDKLPSIQIELAFCFNILLIHLTVFAQNFCTCMQNLGLLEVSFSKWQGNCGYLPKWLWLSYKMIVIPQNDPRSVAEEVGT